MVRISTARTTVCRFNKKKHTVLYVDQRPYLGRHQQGRQGHFDIAVKKIPYCPNNALLQKNPSHFFSCGIRSSLSATRCIAPPSLIEGTVPSKEWDIARLRCSETTGDVIANCMRIVAKSCVHSSLSFPVHVASSRTANYQ